MIQLATHSANMVGWGTTTVKEDSFPSEWHEPFGLVAIEAFAKGTPVIAAAAGAIPELVKHRHNGLLYHAGASDQLAECIDCATSHPAELAQLGRQARQTFEETYSSERNYRMLMGSYQRARGISARPA